LRLVAGARIATRELAASEAASGAAGHTHGQATDMRRFEKIDSHQKTA
jgi:hypothetical protein